MLEIQSGCHTVRSHGIKGARVFMQDWLILLHLFLIEEMMTDLRYPLQDTTVPIWAVPIIAMLLLFVVILIYDFIRKDVYDLHHALLGQLSTMSQSQRAIPHCLLPILVLTALLVHQCVADTGTAVQYDPPQTLTTCGYDPFQFPPSLLLAAAGDEIWQNGAACGRQYKVRCISSDRPKACRPGQWINITIVDQASGEVYRSSSNRATMILPTTAYRAIADLSAKSIKIEFERI